MSSLRAALAARRARLDVAGLCRRGATDLASYDPLLAGQALELAGRVRRGQMSPEAGEDWLEALMQLALGRAA